MQKFINILAVTSFLVSGVVVGGSVYVYTQRDNIKENIKDQIVKGVSEAVPGILEESLGGSQLGSTLLGGSDDEESPIVPLPVVPF